MQTRSGFSYDTKTDHLSDEKYYALLATRFRNWKRAINLMCIRNINMECDDLPDQDYYSAFVEGVSASDMFGIISRDFYHEMMD